MTDIRQAARALWSNWIDIRYREEATLTELRSWFSERPRRPRMLDQFFIPTKAERLGAALRSISHWESYYCVWGSNKETIELSEKEWNAHPPRDRFSRQRIVRPLDAVVRDDSPLAPDHRSMVLQFLLFTIIGPGFSSWLAEVVGVPLSTTVTYELVRCQPGDFIGEHGDNHDPRIIGVTFYLGLGAYPEQGGHLFYRNESGAIFSFAPLFNSVSLIPIDSQCTHWVTPWTDTKPGRETFATSFRKET